MKVRTVQLVKWLQNYLKISFQSIMILILKKVFIILIIILTFLVLCGKFKVLFPLLDNLFANGHRVLLFSQSTVVLNIIQELVNCSFLRIDGSIPPEDRESICQQFCKYLLIYYFY